MDYPKCIASNQKEESISIQRVKEVRMTRKSHLTITDHSQEDDSYFGTD